MNEKCTFFSKITIRWNPTKTHATKLKSTKHKHVVKQYLLKMMTYNQINNCTAYHMMKVYFLSIKKLR